MAQYTQINPDALVTALTPINNSLGGKQDKTDNTLATTDKTISGAINEINTKVGNITGALTWKGKFDTLPAVTDYEAGNVIGVGNKEYVLTVTGSTKAWEELGDEGSYLLKSVAEETYLKKAAGAVATANIADGAVTKEKLANASVTYEKVSNDVQTKLDNNVKIVDQVLTAADQKQVRKNIAIPNYETFDDIIKLGSLTAKKLLYVGESEISIPMNAANLIKIQSTSVEEIDFQGATIKFTNPTITIDKQSISLLEGHGRCRLKNVTISTAMGHEFWDYLYTHGVADEFSHIKGFGYVENCIVVNGFDPTSSNLYGFTNCDHLVNCTVDATIEQGYIPATPFNSCNYLIQCRAKRERGDIIYGPSFYNCNYVFQCYVNGDLNAEFQNCSNIVTAIQIDPYNGKILDSWSNDKLKVGGYDTTNMFNTIKSDGGTGKTKLYAKPDDKSGMATVLLDTTPVNWAVARRTPKGTLKAKDATEDDDLVTKKQLDAAEETYVKKTDIPTIPAIPIVNDPKVSIKMNGAEKGSFTLNQVAAGEVDLGTVLTAHQDISGKVDKTLNAKAFEGITIKTSNTTEAINANKAAIQAYVNNLNMLGVDTTKGFNVPVRTDNNFYGCLTSRYIAGAEGYFLSGTIFSVGEENYIKDIYITPYGRYSELVNIKNDNILNTTSKDLIGAINEVNTLAKSKGNGTITGVKMNGASKGTSGVVDLGTVITSHQDISGKADKSAAIGSLSLSLDSTNYKITLSGTKVDGTTFTVSDVIDLPLESVVVNGSYNNTTKKVVLTLQSGSTVEFSVADLVSGLQSEITSTNKLSADLIADGTTNKVVTASEKTTWNGKQDALTNADVLTGITSTKVSNWDNAATNSHTHSNKSVLDGISSTDITNWNSKTDNAGTVTGVKMNGTTNNPTNGVVDLGTVITAHQDISGKQDKLISGTNIKTINGESVLGSGDITITSSGGASSSAYPEVNHGTGDTTFTITPNTFHVWDEVTSLTLNFGSGISGMANEYLFQFTSGPTATSLALPDDIKWANDNVPTIEANMIYQVSVLRGLASVLEFNNAKVFPIIGDTGGNANEEYAKVYEYFVSTYNLTSASPRPSNGVIITETLICNDTNYGGPVLKVSLRENYLLLWTQKAIDGSFVPRINNLGVYSTYYWD